MRHPFGETVGIRPYTEGGTDAHGNATKAWGSVVDWEGCAVAPASSNESDGDARDSVTTTLTVYGPPEMTVGPRDLAVYQDLEWSIVGEPERWKNPFTGDAPGVVMTIRRSDG